MPSTSVTTSGVLARANGGSITLGLPAFANALACGEALSVQLSSTPLEIPVPSGAKMLYVTPPANNTVGISYKTVNSDAGCPVDPVLGIQGMSLGAGVTNIWLTAASTVSGETDVYFG